MTAGLGRTLMMLAVGSVLGVMTSSMVAGSDQSPRLSWTMSEMVWVLTERLELEKLAWVESALSKFEDHA